MISGKETCLELASKVADEALNLGATQAEVRLVNSNGLSNEVCWFSDPSECW